MLDKTLASYFDALYRPHRLTGKSLNTVRLYQVCLRQLDRHLERPALLSDLTDDNIRGLMAGLVSNGRAITTANKARSHLVALWNFLARKSIVPVWPEVMPLVTPERAPIAWMRHELAQLWMACELTKGTIGGFPAPHFWHGLHGLGWDSGERISALMGIQWADLDLTGWARFPAEVRKGRRRDLVCRLHPQTCDALRKLWRPSGAVLPWDRCTTTIWLHYRRILKRAGLPTDRAHKFHCWRKSVASYFEAAGGNSTKLLGHSNRKTTEAYLDPRVIVQDHACDRLFRPGDDAGRVG